MQFYGFSGVVVRVLMVTSRTMGMVVDRQIVLTDMKRTSFCLAEALRLEIVG
jgi:hypothetical protein